MPNSDGNRYLDDVVATTIYNGDGTVVGYSFRFPDGKVAGVYRGGSTCIIYYSCNDRAEREALISFVNGTLTFTNAILLGSGQV